MAVGPTSCTRGRFRSGLRNQVRKAKCSLRFRRLGTGGAVDDTKYDSVAPGPSFLRPTVNPFTPYSRDESVRSSCRGAVLCFASRYPTPQGTAERTTPTPGVRAAIPAARIHAGNTLRRAPPPLRRPLNILCTNLCPVCQAKNGKKFAAQRSVCDQILWRLCGQFSLSVPLSLHASMGHRIVGQVSNS